MTYDYIDTTERVGDLILQVVADTSGLGDPREDDNLSTMVFLHRRYDLGDRKELTYGESEALEHGGFKALRKHLERQPDGLLAITKVGMYDHSGITIYPIEDSGDGHYIFDAAGWDSGVLGFAYITKKRWTELCGDADPFEAVDGEVTIGMGRITVKQQRVYKALYAEIEEYDDWLRGNVWGFVLTKPCPHDHDDESDERIAQCPHAEVVESIWGFVGDPEYCLKEARMEAQAYA